MHNVHVNNDLTHRQSTAWYYNIQNIYEYMPLIQRRTQAHCNISRHINIPPQSYVLRPPYSKDIHIKAYSQHLSVLQGKSVDFTVVVMSSESDQMHGSECVAPTGRPWILTDAQCRWHLSVLLFLNATVVRDYIRDVVKPMLSVRKIDFKHAH